MTPIEILKKARELIANPRSWGQGYISERNDDGTRCIFQALQDAAVALDASFDVMWEADRLFCLAAGMPETTYNDTHSHAQVLAMIDNAIVWNDD